MKQSVHHDVDAVNVADAAVASRVEGVDDAMECLDVHAAVVQWFKLQGADMTSGEFSEPLNEFTAKITELRSMVRSDPFHCGQDLKYLAIAPRQSDLVDQ